MNLENGFPPNSATQYAGAFFFFPLTGLQKKNWKNYTAIATVRCAGVSALCAVCGSVAESGRRRENQDGKTTKPFERATFLLFQMNFKERRN